MWVLRGNDRILLGGRQRSILLKSQADRILARHNPFGQRQEPSAGQCSQARGHTDTSCQEDLHLFDSLRHGISSFLYEQSGIVVSSSVLLSRSIALISLGNPCFLVVPTMNQDAVAQNQRLTRDYGPTTILRGIACKFPNAKRIR